MKTKNISNLEGTAGYALAQHVEQLNALANLRNPRALSEFVISLLPEMNESAQKYMKDDFLKKVGVQPYLKSYQQLYNIYLAGLDGCRIGVTGKGY